MAISDKLEYLNDTKTLLKQKINNLGGSITDETTFREYAEELDTIYSNLPKVSDTGTEVTLSPTLKGKLDYEDDKVGFGDTKQEGTPTPDSPKNIQSVTGDNIINVCGRNLAYTGWAEDFVSRINNNDVAGLETKDNKNCLRYMPSAGYGDYDNKYLFKTSWKENTQYTIKCSILNNSSQITNNYNVQIYYTDGTITPLFSSNQQNAWISFSYTSAPNKTIKYIASAYYAGTRWLDLDTFMVYEGTDDIPYEPHQEQTYTINLGNIELNKIGNYQDYLYKSGDKWYKKAKIGKIVFDGSESWVKSTTTSLDRFLIGINIGGISAEGGYCNYFKVTSGGVPTNLYEISNNGNAQVVINFATYGTTTKEQFETWLSTHNVVLYYVLATSTDTEITDTSLKEQLDALYNANSYNGTTIITSTYDNNNAQMILQVSALKGE